MHRLIGAKECPIEDLELVGDDLMKWRFKIRSFDDSSQGAISLQPTQIYRCQPVSENVVIEE